MKSQSNPDLAYPATLEEVPLFAFAIRPTVIQWDLSLIPPKKMGKSSYSHLIKKGPDLLAPPLNLALLKTQPWTFPATPKGFQTHSDLHESLVFSGSFLTAVRSCLPYLLKQEIRKFLSKIPVGDFPRPQRITKFRVKRSGKEYQTIIGFGGSFTDAAGLNIGLLSEATQEKLMRSYFGPEGSEYTLCRVPIGGTDFSTRPYSLDDVSEPDPDLTHFSLQPEDHKFKLPYIQWAQNLSSNQEIRLVASPWSAPIWMKTNDRLNGAGSLKKLYYQQWADYFARFLKEYQANGVKVWGVTTGNEPLNGFIPRFPFNCMGWKAGDCADWISGNLGPTLRNLNSSDGLDVKIIMFDDNKGALPTWAKEVLGNKASAQYVSGIGTHWYLDFLTGSEVLSRVHKDYPDQFIIQTEACLGFLPWDLEKVILGSWDRAEKYLEAIIRDVNNWASGWIDWNLALDLDGGPNWAKLAADAAILVNPENDEFFKQPIYYAIAHVSKFVPPGSVRIEMPGYAAPRGLTAAAFRRPDNGTVIVFLNKMNYDAKISLMDEVKGKVSLEIPAKSMQTLLYW